MAEFTIADKQRILQALQQRGAIVACPRCRHQQYEMVGGYFTNLIQQDLVSFQIGGPAVPCVVLICQQCGFVAQHALGPLGLLPRIEGTVKKDGAK